MNRKDLWEVVDKILWGDWGPIGINDSRPNDEYRSYVSSVIKLLKEETDMEKLIKLLHQHANLNMGLSTEKKCSGRSTAKLLAQTK